MVAGDKSLRRVAGRSLLGKGGGKNTGTVAHRATPLLISQTFGGALGV